MVKVHARRRPGVALAGGLGVSKGKQVDSLCLSLKLGNLRDWRNRVGCATRQRLALKLGYEIALQRWLDKRWQLFNK